MCYLMVNGNRIWTGDVAKMLTPSMMKFLVKAGKRELPYNSRCKSACDIIICVYGVVIVDCWCGLLSK